MEFKDFSQLLINKFSFTPTEDQITAIQELSKFLSSNNEIGLFILKGYAGTGKTTLMQRFYPIIQKKNHLPFIKKYIFPQLINLESLKQN